MALATRRAKIESGEPTGVLTRTIGGEKVEKGEVERRRGAPEGPLSEGRVRVLVYGLESGNTMNWIDY